jgi:hypothetical protein
LISVDLIRPMIRDVDLGLKVFGWVFIVYLFL